MIIVANKHFGRVVNDILATIELPGSVSDKHKVNIYQTKQKKTLKDRTIH